MARKSKRGSKGNSTGGTQYTENDALVKLIDARRSQVIKKSKILKVADDDDDNNEKKKRKKSKNDKKENRISGVSLNGGKLLEQFSTILQKFEVPKDANDEQVKWTNNSKRRNDYDNEDDDRHKNKNKNNETVSPVKNSEQEKEGNFKTNETPQISRRKLRKLNKPNLIDLKSQVTHPEVIEWYDCDAPYPLLNAKIKSTKNVVGIPSHWQMKREYLSGRSLLNKKPFELPDIMKQTDIESMRNVLPNGDQQQQPQDNSLKEMARARVQPRLGTLDIDYRKLYDIFFKLGSTWKPDILLPFGDLYYENRNLEEESKWGRIKKTVRPGKISQSLREAMGLREGQLPPWCHKMEKLGMPPSYPNMKIAGLNWDIQFLKDEIYGKVPKINKKKNLNTSYFGQILNFEDNYDEENESKDLDTAVEPKLEDNHVTEKRSEDRNSDKQLITEIKIINPTKNSSVQGVDTNVSSERPLYTVLKETTDKTSNQYTMNKMYSIPGQTSQSSVKTNNTESNQKSGQKVEIEEEEEEQLRNFKF